MNLGSVRRKEFIRVLLYYCKRNLCLENNHLCSCGHTIHSQHIEMQIENAQHELQLDSTKSGLAK
jgi:hypothetical protein